jgi:hypothetical protein
MLMSREDLMKWIDRHSVAVYGDGNKLTVLCDDTITDEILEAFEALLSEHRGRKS